MLNVIIMGLVAAAGLFIGGRWAHQRRKREELLSSPLPSDHARIVRARMPVYRRLPDDLSSRLDGLINRFLSEKKFFGAEGLEITDEIRVTIAAQACLLIVNKPNRWFSTLKTIHVYPAVFRSRIVGVEDHAHTEKHPIRSGESWAKGPVVLAWDHAAYGAFIPHDGNNVVMHEFAHQLDDQTGVTDGAPLLDKGQSASNWARVFRAAYQRLHDDLAMSRENFLNPYGATSPAEFFAVATETFFERPQKLRAQEPDLYRELSLYYRIDPAAWD